MSGGPVRHGRRGELPETEKEARSIFDDAAPGDVAGVLRHLTLGVVSLSLPAHHAAARRAVASRGTGGRARGEQKRAEKEERRRAVLEILRARGVEPARWPKLSRADRQDLLAAVEVALFERGAGASRSTIQEDLRELSRV